MRCPFKQNAKKGLIVGLVDGQAAGRSRVNLGQRFAEPLILFTRKSANVDSLTKPNLLMKIKSSTLSAFCGPRVLAGFVICLAGLTLGFFALAARATPPLVITVNTLLDETTPGDGSCS